MKERWNKSRTRSGAWASSSAATSEVRKRRWARLHLPPKLLGGVFPFVVEVAAEHGGIEVEAGHGHGVSTAAIGWKSSGGL